MFTDRKQDGKHAAAYIILFYTKTLFKYNFKTKSD